MPARISTIVSFSSLGSFGTSRLRSSLSVESRWVSKSSSSAWANSTSSASSSGSIISLVCDMSSSIDLRRCSATTNGSREARSRPYFSNSSMLETTSGDASRSASSSYRWLMLARRSIIVFISPGCRPAKVSVCLPATRHNYISIAGVTNMMGACRQGVFDSLTSVVTGRLAVVLPSPAPPFWIPAPYRGTGPALRRNHHGLAKAV